MGRDMPCGRCVVCDDLVDHSELGICTKCGEAFHWNECGGWVWSKHVCNNCQEENEEEADHG